jgi:hypothetical protein
MLERVEDLGARARYRVEIVTADTTYTGAATLGDDGAVELAIDAPAELVARLQMFAKLLARGAPKRREDGLATWPQRLTRWRPTEGEP